GADPLAAWWPEHGAADAAGAGRPALRPAAGPGRVPHDRRRAGRRAPDGRGLLRSVQLGGPVPGAGDRPGGQAAVLRVLDAGRAKLRGLADRPRAAGGAAAAPGP